jgi:hypothetical protein
VANVRIIRFAIVASLNLYPLHAWAEPPCSITLDTEEQWPIRRADAERAERIDYDRKAAHALNRAFAALKRSQKFPGQSCGRETVIRELDEAKTELEQLSPDPVDSDSRKYQLDEKKLIVERGNKIISGIVQGKPILSVKNVVKALLDLTSSVPSGPGTDLSKAIILGSIVGEQARVADVPDFEETTERDEYEHDMELREQSFLETLAVWQRVEKNARDQAERIKIIRGHDDVFLNYLNSISIFNSQPSSATSYAPKVQSMIDMPLSPTKTPTPVSSAPMPSPPAPPSGGGGQQSILVTPPR